MILCVCYHKHATITTVVEINCKKQIFHHAYSYICAFNFRLTCTLYIEFLFELFAQHMFMVGLGGNHY
jgi:hypothetical protein